MHDNNHMMVMMMMTRGFGCYDTMCRVSCIGDEKGLEALLEGAAAKNVQNQPEVVSASKALRMAKALAEKARADKDAEDERRVPVCFLCLLLLLL